MPVDLKRPAQELQRLQRCINDLADLHALPASWTGRDPSFIGNALLDALVGMLNLDMAFIRLPNPPQEPAIESVRAGPDWPLPAREQTVGQMLDRWLGTDLREWVRPVRQRTEAGEWSIVPLRLELQGELGALVACSRRLDFPRDTERLLLTVAAHLGSMGLRQAQLLGEQQRLAKTLPDTERESRMIVDNIPGLVGLLSATGDVQVVNRQLLEYFGQTLEELRQWGTNGTVHPEDLPHVAEVFSRSIQAGTAYTILQRFRRSDGIYRWFENSGFPLRDSAGRIVRWCVLLTDIDERKRAEDALHESERESRLIVDSIPGLVATFTPSGELEFVNRQILEYFGRTFQELKRWGTDDTTHPEDNARVLKVFTEAIASGEPFEVESRARRSDGVYRWLQSRGFPLRDADGRIVRWYNLLIDIDDRKRAEDALKGNERDLKLIIDTIPVMAWSARPDGSAEFFNQHYLDFVGLSADQGKAWGWTTALHPDDLNGLAATWHGIMASQAPGDAEARLRRFDGEYRWFLFRANPLRDESGRIIKWYGTNTDIHDRKCAQEELDRARSELTRVARVTSLGTLAASITHEVNQPLSGIVTNASTCLRMLAAEPPNLDGARETARRTIRDGHRASEVVNRLRGLFTRKETLAESLDLNAATREVVALMASELRQSGVVVREELADRLPLVSGDRVQLQQVILNLLLNAADAMSGVGDRPRELVLRTRLEESSVCVSVQDSGVGFAP